jgi:predicted MFS family arabinose efflux permease
MSLTGRALVAAMCAGQVGNLLPHVVVPAIMAGHLIPPWGLSAAQAGLMAGAYAFGYMLAVPVLATLTDRIDARRVLIAGSALSGLATAAFGLFAEGLWSATAIWALAGVGFAGAYMPGLKALTDRLPPRESSRSITLYTASFSIGVGLSFLVSQLLADAFGWRAAFFVTALGPVVMIAACFAMAPFRPAPAPAPAPAPGHLLDFRPVLRNRAAMGYVLGYGAHCFERYGMRTWIVAFWTFVVARNEGSALLSPVTVSVLATFLSLPASIFGNEAALRFGRHRAITVVMIVSGAVALAIGLNAGASPHWLLALVLIYAVAIPADSGALTSGMAGSAVPANRGATMALHSTVGFGLSALGGWAGGIALDAAGGTASPSGWLAVFTVFAAGVLLGPLALWWARRGSTEP